MDISEQAFLELHQISRTPRGQMVHADPGRHLFDTSMFRLVWGPAVRGGRGDLAWGPAVRGGRG